MGLEAREKRFGSMAHFIVTAAEAGRTILHAVRARQSLSWSQAKRLFRERRVRIGGVPCADPTRALRRGQRIEIEEQPATKQASQTTDISIRYADPHIVVVEKPAGLTTMRHAEEAAEFGARARKFLPTTLADLLPGLIGRGSRAQVRAVHRLDKETSGLVVFARTVQAESHLGRQFRAHTIERRYLAVVRGRAENRRIESFLGGDRGDGRRGSVTDSTAAKKATTNVTVVERLGEYTLVECRLETGRTHQVRIHLAETGTPLCGERVYDRPLHGKPLPDDSGAPRLALHAATLGLEHPATGKWLAWKSRLPRDLEQLVKRLRKKRGFRE
jgi:23S rRNA pseudouridine1911/1915/1917 synthase